MTAGKPIIGYIRVSTTKQGKSGLGLEAQQKALRDYARASGGRILTTYREVESGRKDDRPELERAVNHAKRSNATLVIAKLDRLARSVYVVSGLMESGVDFAACDNPHANRLTIHILAAVAESEAAAISQRTKDALAAAKRRGVKLGASRPECRNLTQRARKRGAKAAGEKVSRLAHDYYADLAPALHELRSDGLTQQQIADWLNDSGQTTRRGKPFSQVSVKRILDRFEN